LDGSDDCEVFRRQRCFWWGSFGFWRTLLGFTDAAPSMEWKSAPKFPKLIPTLLFIPPLP
jgi:hypothetical protein